MEAQRGLCCALNDVNVIHMDQEEQFHILCDGIHTSIRLKASKKRCLVEVFAMRIIVQSADELERTFGLILLKGSDQNHIIYEDPCDKRGRQFNSEGQLILSGPESGVEVKDVIVIYPWFLHKYLSSCERSKGNVLWKRDAHRSGLDQFIRRGVKIGTKLLQVDFAVYSDGMEARLEVILFDSKFDEGLLQSGNVIEVYGTIKASNSALVQSGAKSVLFDHVTSQECIKLSVDEAGISLPLTRNVTVIPRESALIVDVRLLLSRSSQNVPIAVGSAVFDATTRSNYTVEEQIIPGGHAKVKVRVVWSS